MPGEASLPLDGAIAFKRTLPWLVGAGEGAGGPHSGQQFRAEPPLKPRIPALAPAGAESTVSRYRLPPGAARRCRRDPRAAAASGRGHPAARRYAPTRGGALRAGAQLRAVGQILGGLRRGRAYRRCCPRRAEPAGPPLRRERGARSALARRSGRSPESTGAERRSRRADRQGNGAVAAGRGAGRRAEPHRSRRLPARPRVPRDRLGRRRAAVALGPRRPAVT